MIKIGNKYVLIGEKEDRTFPLPNDDLEHKLRYSQIELTQVEKLNVASILGAYKFLINTTEKDTLDVLKQLREAQNKEG